MMPQLTTVAVIGLPFVFICPRPPRHDKCIHLVPPRHILHSREPWLVVIVSHQCTLLDHMYKTNHNNCPWL
jgi:hypothetical protein